jgi:hypothetical protein
VSYTAAKECIRNTYRPALFVYIVPKHKQYRYGRFVYHALHMYIFGLLPVLWIWNYLVQIRVRIRVRVLLQVDPDPTLQTRPTK